MSWRLAAFGILAGGIAVGFAAGEGRLGRLVPLSTAATLAVAVPIAVASRHPPIEPAAAGLALASATEPPTFSVVVAARDEAAVLAQLVADLARQDYRDPEGNPRYELIVVDDRSVDGTGEAAWNAACDAGIAGVTRIVRRDGANLPDGKGAALTAVPPETCRGDVVLVLDADARIAPAFLRRAAGYFAAGAPALTARRRILEAGSSALAGAQADEQTLDGELQRGRWALGGCSEFRGNGIMVRRDLLAQAGGWRAAALTEDIDLSSRVAAAAGVRVAWAIDAEVWEEPVRTLPSLWRQRQRWAEGALRRGFEHGPAVLRSDRLPIGARLDFATYVSQLSMPPLVLGAMAGAIVRRRLRPMLTILAGYLGLSLVLGWDALRWETDGAGSPLSPEVRAGRAIRVSVFNALWLLALPRALWNLATRRGGVQYVKMEHRGTTRDGSDHAAADAVEGEGRR